MGHNNSNTGNIGKKRDSMNDNGINRLSEREAPRILDKYHFFGLDLDVDQRKLVDSVWNREYKLYLINSLAGSGKSLLSTALGLMFYMYGRYDKIIYITFPGIYEKSQGFLPGDLLEKSEPYFQPLYDALLSLNIEPDHVCNTSPTAVSKGMSIIECAVSTYMRGINLSNAFVIIDESENADLATLTKVLSRIHDDCTVMLIGHSGQCDMYDKTQSGFTACIDYFEKEHPDFCKRFDLHYNHRGIISKTADLLMENCPKPKYGFVYMTVNMSNGNIYIGNHRREMNAEDINDTWFLGKGDKLKKEILKYGFKSFKRYILVECSSQLQLEYYTELVKECYHIYGDRVFYDKAINALKAKEDFMSIINSSKLKVLKDKPLDYPINCYDKTLDKLLKTYYTVEEVKRDNLDLSSVRRVCRGDRLSYKGYRFDYCRG